MHRYRPDLSRALVDAQSGPRGMNERFEAAFTVRCPHCGCTYTSRKLRNIFGLTIAQYTAAWIALFTCLMVWGPGMMLGWFSI